jgi:hypothetical protein
MQMLQLIKKPETGVNGTAVREVQDGKANSLILQEPYQIGRNFHYIFFLYVEGTSSYARSRSGE